MKRIKATGGCLCLAIVLGAIGASSASAIDLRLTTAAGPLAKGQEIKLSSSDLLWVSSFGNFECSENVQTGTISENPDEKGAESGNVKGSVTEQRSAGGEAGGACNTTSPLGRVLISFSGFPWSLKFLSSGKSSLKGNPKLVWTQTYPDAGDAVCTYEASTFAGTFPKLLPKKGESLVGPAMVVTNSNQLFKLNKKVSNAACTDSVEISGDWNVTSRGETVLPEFDNM
jgi:hypothetical protein